MALSEPEYARVDYWIAKQSESIYSKPVFIQKLLEACEYYKGKLESTERDLNKLGNDVYDYKLPLVYETNNKLHGHFGISEIYNLAKSIESLSKAWFPDNEVKSKQNPNFPESSNSTGLNFTTLDRITYLTDYYNHADEAVIDKLLDRQFVDFVNLNKKLEKELERNIVISQNDSSLKRLLKHYLFKLNQVCSFGEPFEGSYPIWSWVPNSHNDRYRKYQYKNSEEEEFIKADKFENYTFARYELLTIVLEQVENTIAKTGFNVPDLIQEMKKSYPISKDLEDHLYLSNIIKKWAGENFKGESSNYIKWHSRNDDSLEQFIKALLEQNLIKEREIEAIIKDHFEPVRDQNREPEPIEWLNTKTLLAYMIDQLDETFIQTTNIWKDTAPHFSKNGKKLNNRILNSSANNYKDNQIGRNGGWSGKPKNHQIIDDILQHLPE